MILWLLKKDIQLVSLTPEKSIKTVADVMCGVSRDRGITEVRMLDHDITAKVQARMADRPLPYRYGLTPSTTVNAFKPKELPSDTDWSSLRSAELGAIFHKRYNQIPCADHCALIWEALQWVKIGDEAPAMFRPTKPKYYLLCQVNIPGGKAIKLK
ncbi:Uncharacterized protein SCF082_LOCUS14174 [Durusdinium trenchii]|uniref:Uncharacterized protein n=1 Tax=Durusdinium trenchii TaxID=1381693 RepID=A0ABP0JW94_9DINO